MEAAGQGGRCRRRRQGPAARGARQAAPDRAAAAFDRASSSIPSEKSMPMTSPPGATRRGQLEREVAGSGRDVE